METLSPRDYLTILIGCEVESDLRERPRLAVTLPTVKWLSVESC